ncbi:unnamed protein product [Brassicogethes aeneus]|uniref:Uncharacterized protein n=1 Tax=Brassicogethes aeneus TaxID=1431903 RepID=A0A9P0B5W7_BRAAE|nr:unnamed protein product [Brassicogethes aeneus]
MPSTFASTQQTVSDNAANEDEYRDEEEATKKAPKSETPPPIVLPFVPANHREVDAMVKPHLKLGYRIKPLYMITVSPHITIQWLNEHARLILNSSVYWERRRNEWKITQCHRCLKCAEPHPTRECTKDKESPAKCVNCQGNHPANSISCPVYIFREQNMAPKATLPTRPAKPFVPAPKPITNHWEARKQAAAANTTAANYPQHQQHGISQHKHKQRIKMERFKCVDDVPLISREKCLKTPEYKSIALQNICAGDGGDAKFCHDFRIILVDL